MIHFLPFRDHILQGKYIALVIIETHNKWLVTTGSREHVKSIESYFGIKVLENSRL